MYSIGAFSWISGVDDGRLYELACSIRGASDADLADLVYVAIDALRRHSSEPVSGSVYSEFLRDVRPEYTVESLVLAPGYWEGRSSLPLGLASASGFEWVLIPRCMVFLTRGEVAVLRECGWAKFETIVVEADLDLADPMREDQWRQRAPRW